MRWTSPASKEVLNSKPPKLYCSQSITTRTNYRRGATSGYEWIQETTNGPYPRFVEVSRDKEGADPVSKPDADAATQTAEQLAKLHSLLEVRQQLLDLSTRRIAVDRRRSLSSRSFLNNYYSANLPVVLTDVAHEWDAIKKWSPIYLGDVLGDAVVEVMTGRDADPHYEVNSRQHKTSMPFRHYLRDVASASYSDNTYLVGNNRLLDAPAATPLWEDFSIDRRYLDDSNARGKVFLWFGPAGTITPLHHDLANALFVQVYGRKVMRLISPLRSHCVYNNYAVYSEVDAAKPDLARHPKFERAHQLTVVIKPGQALFLPVGWWHHVTYS